jgi:uncharacterized membrane protein YhaH (DUF805 family)
MDWYIGVWRQYAVFTGRARRKEYWMFFLVNLAIVVALDIADAAIGTSTRSGFGVLAGLYGLAVLIPSLAVAVRRLHDTDKSGWWVLIGLVPFVGGIILIVLLALDGTPGPNRFGSDPKAGERGQPAGVWAPSAPATAGSWGAGAAGAAGYTTDGPATAGDAPTAPAASPAAGWYPDPTGRHQVRYWDAARWTEHVSDNGVAGVDAL